MEPFSRAARGRAAARSAGTTLAWLYVYSVVWLVGYVVLTMVVFGWRPVVVTGGSMSPSIRPGDVVMLGDAESPVREGAVLTFQRPGEDGLVTHRVTAVLPEGYRTRGDANGSDDSEPVRAADVTGTGHLLIPLLGRPVAWLRSGSVVPLALWLALTAGTVALVRRRPDDDPTARPAAVGDDVAPTSTPPGAAPVVGPADILPRQAARRVAGREPWALVPWSTRA